MDTEGKESIPKREIPSKRDRYKPFWFHRLETFKKQTMTARKLAEDTGDADHISEWRKGIALLRRELNESKRNCFGEFISCIDFRKYEKKVDNFLNKLKNIKPKVVKEPVSDDKEIANAFVKFMEVLKGSCPGT